MFEKLDMAPADPILGLSSAFKGDSNPQKINLGVGVYQDASGQTPILDSVREAEKRILAHATSKSYLAIDGTPEYGQAVQSLLVGAEHEMIASGRAITVQSPGGTGALRIAGDFLQRHYPRARLWLSQPTWANHPKIFAAAGLEVQTYAYFDAANSSLDFDAFLQALKAIPAGDIVLLHGCCHNPTGVDPTPEQWAQIAEVAQECGWLPLVDFAYQGLGDGLVEDAAGLLALCRPGQELLVASSFSKSFGLYQERIGALTLVATDTDAAARALSHLKIAVRTSYSNPPAHGSAIVTEILSDAVLRTQWDGEVAAMRARINGMRKLFVETLKAKGATGDFSFITRQRGMFSYSGLNDEQVQALRDTYSIYIVGDGRINVAGMTEKNMEPLCEAIAAVL
ncbi:MAG: aspartate/tyrosine/aromatic aminotransferase [Candidatus Latescibacterota bacterium]|jgi:aspartate/tyrosine/aromatic aminotransferase